MSAARDTTWVKLIAVTMENVVLRQALRKLQQRVDVAAHWCPRGECEYAKLNNRAPDTIELCHAIMVKFGWPDGETL